MFAVKEGAIAAPTAGFHFTEELLARIPNKAWITLHVGEGTFKPVSSETLDGHKMHQEWFEIPEETIEKIRETKQNGGRVVAVGTTVARTLEEWGRQNSEFRIQQEEHKNAGTQEHRGRALSGWTDIFIYPGFEFKVVDALLTNFHLPKSTLLMLISAFAGKDFVFRAYQEAIENKYRFYSFGDAMLII